MIINKLYIILAIYDQNSNLYILARYLLDHINNISNIKMKDIINDTKLSKSTLSRCFKKLGYTYFSDIQQSIEEGNNRPHELIGNHQTNEKYLSYFKNKKRIIVIGEIDSILVLFAYKTMFERIHIHFEILIITNNYLDTIQKIELNNDDIVVVVSLFSNSLELIAVYLNKYADMLKYLDQNKIDYVFVGNVAPGGVENNNSINIQTNEKSQMIYELCCLFEDIYNDFL